MMEKAEEFATYCCEGIEVHIDGTIYHIYIYIDLNMQGWLKG